MADFTFTVDASVLEALMRNLPEQIERFLDEEAELVKNDIVQNFGTSPAPPNNPPGVDTGTLRASITWERDGQQRRRIMDGVEYGVYLELGSTRHHFKWPFMGPAFERERGLFADHARDAGLVKP